MATLFACVLATTPGYAADESDNDASDNDTSITVTTVGNTSDSDTMNIEATGSSETGAYQMRTPVRERSIVLVAPTVEVRTTIGPGTTYVGGVTYTTVSSRNSTGGSTTATVTPGRGRFVPRERR